MLGLSLGLRLLLRLRGLLGRLLSSFFLCLLLLASAAHSTSRRADRSARSCISGNCSDGSTSGRSFRRAFYGPALGR